MIHESYVLPAKSASVNPLSIVSCTRVATEDPISRLLASTRGTSQARTLASSRSSSCTSSTERATVREPKLAAISDDPAESACMRVLLADETNTTKGSDELRLVWPVTVCSVASVRRATAFAVAWK